MDFEIALDTVWLLCRLAFINWERCTERNSWLLNSLSALAASLTGKIKAQCVLSQEGSHPVPGRWKGFPGAGTPPHLAEMEPQDLTQWNQKTEGHALGWGKTGHMGLSIFLGLKLFSPSDVMLPCPGQIQAGKAGHGVRMPT